MGNYGDPCSVSQVRLVTGGTNEYVGQGLGEYVRPSRCGNVLNTMKPLSVQINKHTPLLPYGWTMNIFKNLEGANISEYKVLSYSYSDIPYSSVKTPDIRTSFFSFN